MTKSSTIQVGNEFWSVEYNDSSKFFAACEKYENGEDLLNEIICEDWVVNAGPIATMEEHTEEISGEMTIEEALEFAATEDTTLAKENGSVIITETKIGNIDLRFENGFFTALNSNYEIIKDGATEKEMKDFLKLQYEIVTSN